MPTVRRRSRGHGRYRSIWTIIYATGIGGLVMEQETQKPPDSRVWDNRATEVIAEARKMPLGDRRRAALREAERLRIAAETYRWLATK
jgi:hypothetical protein